MNNEPNDQAFFTRSYSQNLTLRNSLEPSPNQEKCKKLVAIPMKIIKRQSMNNSHLFDLIPEKISQKDEDNMYLNIPLQMPSKEKMNYKNMEGFSNTPPASTTNKQIKLIEEETTAKKLINSLELLKIKEYMDTAYIKKKTAITATRHHLGIDTDLITKEDEQEYYLSDNNDYCKTDTNTNDKPILPTKSSSTKRNHLYHYNQSNTETSYGCARLTKTTSDIDDPKQISSKDEGNDNMILTPTYIKKIPLTPIGSLNSKRELIASRNSLTNIELEKERSLSLKNEYTIKESTLFQVEGKGNSYLTFRAASPNHDESAKKRTDYLSPEFKSKDLREACYDSDALAISTNNNNDDANNNIDDKIITIHDVNETEPRIINCETNDFYFSQQHDDDDDDDKNADSKTETPKRMLFKEEHLMNSEKINGSPTHHTSYNYFTESNINRISSFEISRQVTGSKEYHTISSNPHLHSKELQLNGSSTNATTHNYYAKYNNDPMTTSSSAKFQIDNCTNSLFISQNIPSKANTVIPSVNISINSNPKTVTIPSLYEESHPTNFSIISNPIHSNRNPLSSEELFYNNEYDRERRCFTKRNMPIRSFPSEPLFHYPQQINHEHSEHQLNYQQKQQQDYYNNQYLFQSTEQFQSQDDPRYTSMMMNHDHIPRKHQLEFVFERNKERNCRTNSNSMMDLNAFFRSNNSCILPINRQMMPNTTTSTTNNNSRENLLMLTNTSHQNIICNTNGNYHYNHNQKNDTIFNSYQTTMQTQGNQSPKYITTNNSASDYINIFKDNSTTTTSNGNRKYYNTLDTENNDMDTHLPISNSYKQLYFKNRVKTLNDRQRNTSPPAINESITIGQAKPKSKNKTKAVKYHLLSKENSSMLNRKICGHIDYGNEEYVACRDCQRMLIKKVNYKTQANASSNANGIMYSNTINNNSNKQLATGNSKRIQSKRKVNK